MILSEPFITVIVVAHKRKDYIISALQSLNSQDIDKSLFETIVVKSFTDIEVDNYIEESGFKNVCSDEQSLGSKLISGVEKSEGEVICFLEDDDLFDKRKLSYVHNLFSRDAYLSYYHNYFDTVDSSGRISKRVYRGSAIGTEYIRGRNDLNKLRTLSKLNPGFNLSCITIRKETILRDSKRIRGLTAGIDSFIFYSILSTNRGVMANAEKLTYFRVHEGSSTHSFSSYSTFLSNTSNYFVSHLETMSEISEMKMPEQVNDHFQCLRAESETGYTLLNTRKFRKDHYKNLATCIKCLPVYKDRFHTFYTILVSIALMSPRAARLVFYVSWKTYMHGLSSG